MGNDTHGLVQRVEGAIDGEGQSSNPSFESASLGLAEVIDLTEVEAGVLDDVVDLATVIELNGRRRTTIDSGGLETTPTDILVDLRPVDPVIQFRGTRRPQLVDIPARGLLEITPLGAVSKRAVDVIGAGLGILLFLPVLLASALAIKLTSRGPVLYVSTRVGRDGREFRFIKFRTMRAAAELDKESLRELNEVPGPVFKMKQDPRVTPVGKLLRKLSIDEIPQLVHVLEGHMSLVGPRPPTPDEVITYSDHELQRLLVKPGITCTWQVSGRSEVGFDRWVEMDLEYIEQWSLWLDVRLIAATLPAVLSTRGAY